MSYLTKLKDSIASQPLVFDPMSARTDLMSVSAVKILAALSRVSPARMTDLADLCGVAGPAITEVVDRLDAKGFTNRVRSKDDRRFVMLGITKKGRAEISKMVK